MSKSNPIDNVAQIEEDDDVQALLENINAKNYVMENNAPLPANNSFVDNYSDQFENDPKPSFSSIITYDIKMSVIVAALFVVVSQIPLEKLVYNYIALDKIPYANVIVKAVIIGALFFLFSYFM
jgi:hypothetical protein